MTLRFRPSPFGEQEQPGWMKLITLWRDEAFTKLRAPFRARYKTVDLVEVEREFIDTVTVVAANLRFEKRHGQCGIQDRLIELDTKVRDEKDVHRTFDHECATGSPGTTSATPVTAVRGRC